MGVKKMVTVTTCISFDPTIEKYLVVGHSTEADSGKTSPWEVIEEVLRISNSLFDKRWETLEEAIDDIKSHSAFRVKVKNAKREDILSGQCF